MHCQSDFWSPTFSMPNYMCLILLLPGHHGNFTNLSVSDVSKGLKNFFVAFSSKLMTVLSLITFFLN
jgi:hypothetical protein